MPRSSVRQAAPTDHPVARGFHSIVAPSLGETPIGAQDAGEGVEYFARFDRQLRALPGIAALPWPIG